MLSLSMGRNSYTDEDASIETLDTPTTFSNVFLGLFCFRASARGVVVKQTSSLYVFTMLYLPTYSTKYTP